MTEVVAIICGGSGECPTCGRDTDTIIGPCSRCCESWEKTGKFLRRKARPKNTS